jgi:hypothetical protein
LRVKERAKERVKRVECAECFGPESSHSLDAVQKQLADDGVELASLD